VTTILAKSGNKKDKLLNKKQLTVTGWDRAGNPIADGKAITHRNICHAYASTGRSVQGATSTRMLMGFDRYSIKTASRDIAYMLAGPRQGRRANLR
jgi:hypothetical protein